MRFSTNVELIELIEIIEIIRFNTHNQMFKVKYDLPVRANVDNIFYVRIILLLLNKEEKPN